MTVNERRLLTGIIQRLDTSGIQLMGLAAAARGEGAYSLADLLGAASVRTKDLRENLQRLAKDDKDRVQARDHAGVVAAAEGEEVRP